MAELAATGVQVPGTIVWTALLLVLQVVTARVVGSVLAVQLCTGATVGPVVAQVVATKLEPEVAGIGVQLPSATGVGPVVTAAGHSIVTQLLSAVPVCALHVPGATPTVVGGLDGQVVVV